MSQWLWFSWETQLISKTRLVFTVFTINVSSAVKTFLLGHHAPSTGEDDNLRSLKISASLLFWLVFLVAPRVLGSVRVFPLLPRVPFFFASWFFSSHHIHWSVERRISQTTPFTSYQIEPILPPYQHSLCLLPYQQQSLWWTESRSVHYIPPPSLIQSDHFSLVFWVCALSFCLCCFPRLFVWLLPSLRPSRWGSVKSSGKWPAC